LYNYLKREKLPDYSKINISQRLNLANQAALEAGAGLRKNKGAWNVLVKEAERDRKLRADLESEKILLRHLLDNSDYPLLTEETGWHGLQAGADANREPEVFWLIDPLDGTVNYATNIPLCCVSVALVCAGKPILGAVYDFERDELFSGGYNIGLTVNGQATGISKAIKKSESILMTGFPKARDFSENAMAQFGVEASGWQKVRMIGSAALSMAYVAAGRADAYQEESIMPWDIAAGWALVEAAGGKVEVQMDDFMTPLTLLATNRGLE
jgi:myo-inositol-1(or 4)-monophosphatase